MSQNIRSRDTKEFKEEAIKRVKEQGYAVAEATRNLGMRPSVVNRWKREFGKSEGGALNPSSIVSLQAELKRLRKLNKRLEMEREILKKAATFFARES